MKIKTFYAASLLFIYSGSAFALAAGEACSSQGSTAHTGSSSGGVSLMCNGSTWVEIVTYNTTGEAHFKKPLKTADPVANTDVATKEYVDNAVASAGGAGGGVPTYMGLSSAITNGSGGGYKAMSMQCNSTYPGSRMMNSMDYIKIVHKMPVTEHIKKGWIECVNPQTVSIRSSYYTSFCGGLISIDGISDFTCSGWNGNGGKGLVLNGAGGLETADCNATLRIQCVKD